MAVFAIVFLLLFFFKYKVDPKKSYSSYQKDQKAKFQVVPSEFARKTYDMFKCNSFEQMDVFELEND